MEKTRAQLLRGWNWFTERTHTKVARVWFFVIFFLESIIFPIPPDPLLLVFSGIKKEWWWRFALIATSASVFGAVVGYILSVFFYDIVGARIVALYGFEEEVDFVAAQFAKSTFFVMFVAAFTPLPFKVFVLTAGFVQVSFLPFLLGGTLGRFIRYFTIAYLVKEYGERVAALVICHVNRATIALVLVVFCMFIFYRVFG